MNIIELKIYEFIIKCTIIPNLLKYFYQIFLLFIFIIYFYYLFLLFIFIIYLTQNIFIIYYLLFI
jgi:hypothetical protein